jgi:hypothetical protein
MKDRWNAPYGGVASGFDSGSAMVARISELEAENERLVGEVATLTAGKAAADARSAHLESEIVVMAAEVAHNTKR